ERAGGADAGGEDAVGGEQALDRGWPGAPGAGLGVAVAQPSAGRVDAVELVQEACSQPPAVLRGQPGCQAAVEQVGGGPGDVLGQSAPASGAGCDGGLPVDAVGVDQPPAGDLARVEDAGGDERADALLADVEHASSLSGRDLHIHNYSANATVVDMGVHQSCRSRFQAAAEVMSSSRMRPAWWRASVRRRT